MGSTLIPNCLEKTLQPHLSSREVPYSNNAYCLMRELPVEKNKISKNTMDQIPQKQPWRALMADGSGLGRSVMVKDEDEFKQGEIIVIGGQSAPDPGNRPSCPEDSLLYYDTANKSSNAEMELQ
ncbi:hypothetical protein AWENTII_003298 [Aspergillus wentii]|nr:hypothetical protein MW887_012029 [Aspergillus wentii]